ncbi:MAG: zinc-dependent metalloprotease [Solirubrobacterales bacterium]|nr:zinc-dependent metalloprotease [Solirubrobacterales bacterium]
MDSIDWGLAQRVGELLAGSPPPGGRVHAGELRELAGDFAARVGDYSGLQPPGELPPLDVVDRAHWIQANLATMRPLVERMTDQLAHTGPLSGTMRSASGVLLGLQVGAITGVLSQRVLGQYDLSIVDPSAQARLLLVSPNLAQAARNLDVDREELTSWVTIHEVTHAVQFAGAPWLREHLAEHVESLLEKLRVSISGESVFNLSNLRSLGDLRGLGDVGAMRAELRALLEKARRGELLRLTLGEQRWAIVERLQATMSLVEGHAEHVMDAVGADVLPSLPRLRRAMTHRRESRAMPWRLIERLLGIDLKMRQYEVGRHFCDEVVRERGRETLARAWAAPEQLPSMAELESPALWLARVG